jgi:hypothetical protein
MATYVPNATQATEPVGSRPVGSAAEEFRTLKSSINNMRQWLGISATAPTTDTLGNAVAAGDFYFNSTSLKMFVYDGTVWRSVDKTATVSGGAGTSVQLSSSSPDTVLLAPTGNFTVQNTGMLDGQSVLLLVIDAGSYTATWPAGVKWLNGATPSLLATGVTFVQFIKIDAFLYGAAIGGAV